MNWYLLQTKANEHSRASENLKRQGFEVFLPLMSKTLKSAGKFVNKTVPLFPNYLFVGTQLNEIPWKSINATRGISKAVTLDGNYRRIDSQIIEGIKYRCNESGILQSINHLASGDRVKIERGPFAEFICSVDSIADSGRAWLLIDILQQHTRVQVALSDLSKVS